MEITEFAFKLLLLFFPGIICAYIVDQLTVHKPREATFFLLQSFVLGILSYFTYWGGLKLVHNFFPNSFHSYSVTFLRALTDSKVTFSLREIANVTGLSIILACLVSLSSRFKWPNRLARRIGLTKKFGELDVWGYLLNLNNDDIMWLTVRDHERNLIFDGWVQAFSDDSKDAELLLRDVSVYKNDTGEPLYQTGAVYLSRKRESISIECRALAIDNKVLWKENSNEQQQNNPQTTTPT
jgi:hypothetical protein